MFLKIRVNLLVRKKCGSQINNVHPIFFPIIKEPFAINEFLDFLPRSLIINKKKETPKGYKCSIEELNTKDDNT